MKKDTGKKEWKKETYIKLVQKKKKIFLFHINSSSSN